MGTAEQTLGPLRDDPARSAVLCDVDGTLAPITRDPSATAVPPEAREVLEALASRYGLVACVTGRRATTARRIVGIEGLTYAGNHGLELLRPGERTPQLDPALGRRGTAAAGLVARLDWTGLGRAGLHLEDKGPIQAIHWRGAGDEEVAEQHAQRIAELVEEEGLHPHFGRKVLEVRPVAEIHKGAAARRLVAESQARAAMFGGDDRTDLDAFAALRDLRDAGELEAAVCVGVASDEGPEAIQRDADVVVDGTEGFLDLLRAL